MRYTTDTQLDCDCGNPVCHANLQVRRGFVEITHEDGSITQRWDYLHIDAFDGKGAAVQMMVPPKEARKLLWFMVQGFCPGINFLCTLTNSIRRLISYYCYWRWV